MVYGPLPADVSLRNSSAVSVSAASAASVPPFSSTTALLTMPSVGLVTIAGTAVLGSSDVMTTVCSSGASTVRPAIRNEPLPWTFFTRLSEKTTSAEVSGVPSEKVMSSRIVNVYSVASSLTDHSDATLGSGSSALPPANVRRLS
jgi:hypothetical protein